MFISLQINSVDLTQEDKALLNAADTLFALKQASSQDCRQALLNIFKAFFNLQWSISVDESIAAAKRWLSLVEDYARNTAPDVSIPPSDILSLHISDILFPALESLSFVEIDALNTLISLPQEG